MEQMTNLRIVVPTQDLDAGEISSWRSFSSVASVLLARAESQRAEVASDEDRGFVPVAWAAE